MEAERARESKQRLDEEEKNKEAEQASKEEQSRKTEEAGHTRVESVSEKEPLAANRYHSQDSPDYGHPV